MTGQHSKGPARVAARACAVDDARPAEYVAAMLARAVVVLASVTALVVVTACGGSSPNAAAPAAASTAPASQGSAGEAPAAKAPTPATKTAADHHRDFMNGCMKKAVNSPDYCECAWSEIRKEFTDEELSASEIPPARLDRAKAQVVGACASKIPEENVKTGYDNGCQGGRPEMKAYCDCTWTEFRKRFSVAELGDDATVQGERFVAARTPVVKACAAKMPEGVAKEAFMKGCAKDPKAEAFCGCAWKELRKQVSAAEIEAAAFDQEKVFAQVEKGCGKLRPAK